MILKPAQSPAPHAIAGLDALAPERACCFPLRGWLGLLLIVTAEIVLFTRVDPFRSWYFLGVWWGYILFADGLLDALEGRSLIRRLKHEFLLMLPLSTFIWLVFEAFNLRLQNWHYINLIHPLWLRWIGFAVAFATVLPGVFLTADWLRALAERFNLGLSRWRWKPLTVTPRLESWLIAMGTASLILPLVWPRYFFPLVWGAFIFLIEPWNRRLGVPSILADLEQGDPRRAIFLLLSGFVCGFLWEVWNYWAFAKWIYTVPFMAPFPKIFEMPLPGFFGFPPFVLECFAMHGFCRHLMKRGSGAALP